MPTLPRSANSMIALLSMLLLALAPPITAWFGEPFILDLILRGVILAVAAVSLNLILGYGGMVSFGHAAYIGLGAYSVGIPAYYGIYDGWSQLAVTMAVCGLFAALTGFICLRTRGVYFIMITLAFAQMVYFALVSVEEYGADDGLLIEVRSEFPRLLDLEDNVILFYLSLGVLAVCLYLVHRLVGSRFGLLIRGASGNDARLQSLGLPTFRYRLLCYVISGMMCGMAGWLLGNFTNFISPEMMSWTRSGELIFMVVLGGAGTPFGPVLGTAAFIFIEELLSGITVYWQLYFGAFLVLVVLFGRGGLHGLIERLSGGGR